MPLNYKGYYNRLVKLRDNYTKYLTAGEELTLGAHLKLINEISRIDRQIKNIEQKNLKELREYVTRYEIEAPSKLNQQPALHRQD